MGQQIGSNDKAAVQNKHDVKILAPKERSHSLVSLVCLDILMIESATGIIWSV